MKRLPTFLFCTVMILLAAQAQTVFAAPIATVQTAIGTTFKRRATNSYVALARRTPLNSGDVVRTGAKGKANLLFYDGSQARLGNNSAVQITEPTNAGGGRKSFFRALSGQVWARLRPGTAVRTRTAVAGVRGTEILLQVADDETTTLTVIEGSVDFSNEFGAVVVNQSQQSVAAPGRAPTSPITIDNPGLLIEWTFDLDYAVLPREKFWTGVEQSTLRAALPARANAAKANPGDSDAQRDYGDVLFDLHRYAEAQAAYLQAAQNAPAGSLAIRLGYAALELGALDEAETQFRLALGAPAVAIANNNTPRFQNIDWSPAQAQLQNVAAGDAVSTQRAAALVGLTWLELSRNRAQEAEKWARQAVAAGPDSAEAHIALGVTLLRQKGELEEAIAAFEKAQNAQPEALRYQAQAWQVLALLARGDNAGALTLAQAATKAQPDSGLARGHLALAMLYNNQAYDAAKEARRAVALNPDAVAARVALAQTLLARGDNDAAAQEAATAAALDPQLPQAFYVLGLADAARRDYSHAARELQDSLRIAPDFLPAAAALARVYNLMGREKDATVLLTDFQTRFPKSDEVYAARGQVFYQQGKYREAAEQYQKAVELQPQSALYQAELARLLLDDNQLNAALKAGQRAVYLAPKVGQYHALLGLIADFSNLSSYADREFRTAIAVDPQNALARAQLGVRNSNPRTGVNTITQSFLFDPAVSRQLFRGGIDTELTLSAGSDDAYGALLAARQQNDDGSLYLYGITGYNRSDGSDEAPNDDAKSRISQGFLTWLPDNKTSVLVQGVDIKTREGYNGPDRTQDDRFDLADRRVAISARRRFGGRHHLWLGGLYDVANANTLDDNADSNLSNVLGPFFLFDRFNGRKTRTVEPEVRLDLNLNARPSRRTTLTFGAAYPKAFSRTNADVFTDFLIPSLFLGDSNAYFDRRAKVFYAQLASRVNDKLSFIAQLQRQDIDTKLKSDLLGSPFIDSEVTEQRLLPALLVNYQLDQKTALRFFANRRSEDVGFQAFLPTEALLSSEGAALPNGTYGQSRLYELDIERYFSPRTFGKLFFFRSSAQRLTFGTGNTLGTIVLDEATRTGVGLRVEHQLSDNLFANLAMAASTTDNRDAFAPYDGKTAPYHPGRTARFSLNYVDPKGNKAALVLNYTGSFFRDSAFTGPNRERFPNTTTLDLRIAREPSLRNEVFLNVLNVFDTDQIRFDQFPAPGRRFEIGWTRRF